MVIIKFKDGAVWFKANWVFRQLADDTIAAFPSDAALKMLMDQAQANGALFLESMEADSAAATLRAIEMVARETISGTILGWKSTKPDDQGGQEMYLEAIAELLELINNQR